MHINDFFKRLKTRRNWNKDEISLDISSAPWLSKRLKFTYPLFIENVEKTFKISGSCIVFKDVELYSIVYLIGFFSNFSDNMKVYNRGNAIRFEILIINQDTGDEDTLIVQYTHSENDSYKYVQLTNIVIPPFAKYNRLSLMIIRLLYLCANDFGYDMWVTQIVNECWINTLINHGGVLDSETGMDVQIMSEFWIFEDDVDRTNYCLNFNISKK